MGLLERRVQGGVKGWGCGWWGAAAVVSLCCGGGAPAEIAKPAAGWDAAVVARSQFEAEPRRTHTREEYARVMNAFRAIYHADPDNAHAAEAVAQVAELLNEQGREFGDKKNVHDAAGQYEYLAKAYPGDKLAAEALVKALALLGPRMRMRRAKVRAAAGARIIRGRRGRLGWRLRPRTQSESDRAPGGDEWGARWGTRRANPTSRSEMWGTRRWWRVGAWDVWPRWCGTMGAGGTR